MSEHNGQPPLSRDTLTLLHRVLCAQQLAVGDQDFRAMAQAVTAALDELEAALSAGPELPTG